MNLLDRCPGCASIGETLNMENKPVTDKGKNLRQMAEQLKEASEALEKEALEEDLKVSLAVPDDDILDDFVFKVDLEMGSSSVYRLVGEPKTPRAEEFIASLDKFISSMSDLHGIYWAQKQHGFADQWHSVLNQLRECSGILVVAGRTGRLNVTNWAKGPVVTVSTLPPSELLSVINNNPNWKFSNLPSTLKTLQKQLDRARTSVRDCERLKAVLETLTGACPLYNSVPWNLVWRGQWEAPQQIELTDPWPVARHTHGDWIYMGVDNDFGWDEGHSKKLEDAMDWINTVPGYVALYRFVGKSKAELVQLASGMFQGVKK